MTRISLFIIFFLLPLIASAADRPNVILILTDDQGFGDVGFHGNSELHTPYLDQLAEESTELTNFYVQPLCTPTRAALLTGRYPERTGAVEVNFGRSIIREEEVTIAEELKAAGYRTGIFGKWHLGDNYPVRPSDMGFEECLHHTAGGVGQAGDPPGNTYFDPILQHNNVPKKYEGYCNDIFFQEAMDYAESHKDEPFFIFLATNLPHLPLQVDEKYVKPYRKYGVNEINAKTYGMIANIDENVGYVMKRLKELELEDDTIVIFLSDNGPRTSRQKNDLYPDRYNAGLRGTKSSMYEGGIRVPFLIRWPNKIKAGAKLPEIAAHIDLLPTLLDACGALISDEDRAIDGQSLIPLLTNPKNDWPDRMLFFQHNANHEPLMYSHFAARSQRYKIVQPLPNPRDTVLDIGEYDINAQLKSLELYDIENDPSEITNIANVHPELVESMMGAYENWYRDVTAELDYWDPQRIYLGAPEENPAQLSTFDLQKMTRLPFWSARVTQAGTYRFTLKFNRVTEDCTAYVRFGTVQVSQPISAGSTSCVFESVNLPKGDGRLEAWLKKGLESKTVQFLVAEHY
ncbi:arylsulfatase [Opitutia bacterium ISCC 51]|nr:arylsulfatase [Opitutae bacterium ISCC 51]QXD27135.1 arylsulfatase [Opitutae bacterium ISCC 52]